METEHQTTEEFKISGVDIWAFFKKVFRAGNARQVVFKKENGTRFFGLNLIIFSLLVFVVPALALLCLVLLVLGKYSLTIEKTT